MDKNFGTRDFFILENMSFPSSLNTITDPPKFLYGLGNANLLNMTGIAIVGMRDPSEWGQKVSFRLAQILDRNGYCIVSGLATGIDTASHRGSLTRNGNTIAVLPSGFNHITPEENYDLAQEIAKRGLLLSEYEPDVKPRAEQYIERDRIQAGLSDVVIVVETDLLSGTMHTARFCREYGKQLIVVRRDDIDLQLDGNTALLQNGAFPLDGDEAEDIVSLLQQLDKSKSSER